MILAIGFLKISLSSWVASCICLSFSLKSDPGGLFLCLLNPLLIQLYSELFLSIFTLNVIFFVSLLLVCLLFFLQLSCITFALREGLREEHTGVLGSKYLFFSLCSIPMLSAWVLCSFVLFFILWFCQHHILILLVSYIP